MGVVALSFLNTAGTFSGGACYGENVQNLTPALQVTNANTGERAVVVLGLDAAAGRTATTSSQDLLGAISTANAAQAIMDMDLGDGLSATHTFTVPTSDIRYAISGCVVKSVGPLDRHVYCEAFASATCGSASASVSTTLHLGPASATRAILIDLGFYYAPGAITVTLNGVDITSSLISGTDSTSYGGRRCFMYGVASTLTGPQAVAATWANNSPCTMVAMGFQGVNATTPFNNGTATGHAGSASTIALTITSVAGDLTTSYEYNVSTTILPTTSQTFIKSAGTAGGAGNADLETGAGIGTSTHTWTASFVTDEVMSGCNVVQAPIAVNVFVY